MQSPALAPRPRTSTSSTPYPIVRLTRHKLRTTFAACLALTTFLQHADAAALALDMPAPAAVVGGWTESPSTLSLPVGPYTDGKLPLREAAGFVTQRAYRMDDQRMTTLQLITPLLKQLQDSGYTTVYQCETSACGGFDFRYGMEVLPEPQMHVDLGDFRYVAAERMTQNGPDMVALLVSKSDYASYVQVTTIAPLPPDASPASPQRIALPATPSPLGAAAPTSQTPAAPISNPNPSAAATGAALTADTLAQAFASSGAVALDDLSFPSGSATLEDKDYTSLTVLAQWLKDNPTQQVVLVGHTDAEGSLATNTALSQRRAQSVRAALIDKLGVKPSSIDAEGAGYLAPRASNATPEGRAQNRRVEAVLIPAP